MGYLDAYAFLDQREIHSRITPQQNPRSTQPRDMQYRFPPYGIDCPMQHLNFLGPRIAEIDRY